MDELTQQVADKLGIGTDQAERAVGVLLSLVQTNADPEKADALFEKLPGAGELATQYGSVSSGGGLLGKLGGAIGGHLAALSKLQAAGLDTDQMKALGRTVLDYARENAGDELVDDVAASIPGLGSYL